VAERLNGWAYTTTAAWVDPTMLSTTLPDARRAGQATGANWDSALAALNGADPTTSLAMAS
jgi:hypothetical protein